MLNHAFYYRNGALTCEDVPLQDLAAQAGTPLYVYSANRILSNTERLKTTFAGFEMNAHYSLKANANLSLIRLLHGAGLGMDAVSGGEIFRARKAGVPAQEIVFAGVGKTRHEIAYALQEGVGWFNVESQPELALINQIAGDLGKTTRVALRINPKVQAKTHHHIATGHGESKFGIDLETAEDILRHQAAYPHITIEGIHVHIGSQLGDVAETVEAVKRAQALAQPYPHLRTLNIGGGFPVAYSPDDEYPPVDAFAHALQPVLSGWQVKLEPGRYIVADAGALLISVIYTKSQNGKPFVITDGSMTELIRPALYEAVHPILPLQQSEAVQEMVVAGPVCESADILRTDASLPDVQSGDVLAVLMAGAYGFVMASNYNQRPRPAEVMVEGSTWRVIRQRETWEDLIRLED